MYYVCETQKMLENVVKRSEFSAHQRIALNKGYVSIIIYLDLTVTVRVSGVRGALGWFPVYGAEQRFCASRRFQTERLQRE